MSTNTNFTDATEAENLLDNNNNDQEPQLSMEDGEILDSLRTSTPSFRDCLAFALPALGIYACPPLMSLIDASFIGRVSSLELAALGPASSISDSAPLPLLFLSIGSTNLIAKAFSKNDQPTLARVSRTALGMGAMGGLVLAMALYFNASPLSVLYCGTSASTLAPPCTQYVAIRALALPFVVLATIAQAISIGTKDSRTPMISVALAGALNLFGDLVLVKFLKQGIAGAAWATAASQILAAGLLLQTLKKRGFLEKPKVSPQSTSTPPPTTLQTVQQLLSFVPFLFIMLVKMFWHNSCSATAASLGGAQAAAHTALLSVAMLCFLLGDAGSSLAQAFLPAFVVQTESNDRKDAVSFDLEAALPTVKQLLKTTLTISASAVAISAAIIGRFGNQITSDPAVLAEMKKTLPWIVTALSFHGSAVTLEGLLLVRKKFRPLSLCYTLLAVTVAAFQVATQRLNWGLAGVWGCYVWFCASRVITFSALGGLLRPKQWFQRIKRRNRTIPAEGTV
jgi:Na+-driven multidrug efflux pump